jgi:hypothetical protein
MGEGIERESERGHNAAGDRNVNTEHLERALRGLAELGATELEHVNGDLAQHLKGTYTLLAEWDNSEPLCLAGLYHAVYGTAGFPAQLLPLERRSDIVAAIGVEAEELVYFYAACDRQYTYEQIISEAHPRYRDRFSNETYIPKRSLLVSFCELTLANELEIVSNNSDFGERFRVEYIRLFAKFRGLVSERAFKTYLDIFRISD